MSSNQVSAKSCQDGLNAIKAASDFNKKIFENNQELLRQYQNDLQRYNNEVQAAQDPRTTSYIGGWAGTLTWDTDGECKKQFGNDFVDSREWRYNGAGKEWRCRLGSEALQRNLQSVQARKPMPGNPQSFINFPEFNCLECNQNLVFDNSGKILGDASYRQTMNCVQNLSSQQQPISDNNITDNKDSSSNEPSSTDFPSNERSISMEIFVVLFLLIILVIFSLIFYFYFWGSEVWGNSSSNFSVSSELR